MNGFSILLYYTVVIKSCVTLLTILYQQDDKTFCHRCNRYIYRYSAALSSYECLTTFFALVGFFLTISQVEKNPLWGCNEVFQQKVWTITNRRHL